MAKNKKISSAAKEREEQAAAAMTGAGTTLAASESNVNEEITISEKLKLAEGSINRANSDAKARMSEKEKQREESKTEAKEKLAEAKRQQKEYEKYAKQVAEQKMAAFEYAENYRRKLMKDKERALTAAKRKKKAEEEAALARAREEKALEMARLIEAEREEARARSARATELLERVTKRAIPDEDGNLTYVTRHELRDIERERAAKEAEAAEAAKREAEAVEAAKKEAEAAEAAKKEAAEIEAAKKEAEAIAAEAAAADKEAETIAPVESAEETATPLYGDVKKSVLTDEERLGAVLYITDEDEDTDVSPASDGNMVISVHDTDELSDVIEGAYVFDSEDTFEDKSESDEPVGQIEESAPAAEPESMPARTIVVVPAPSKEPEPVAVPVIKKPDPLKVVIPEPTEDDELCYEELPIEYEEPEQKPVSFEPRLYERDTEINILDDDIVEIIKKMGREVENKKQLKKYLKRSDKAVRSLEKNIKKINRDLEKRVDENDAPATMVELIKVSGRVLEIRCDNLSVSARVGVKKYVKKYQEELHEQINAYNGRVLSYASLTGEQLTRISSFLPDHLINGTGRAVIPKLSYRENYLELYVDEKGNASVDTDNVTTTIVSPDVTAAELLGDALIETQNATVEYGKRTRRADSELLSEIELLEKSIAKNEKQHAILLSKENRAIAEFKEKATRLEDKTPPSKRTKPKYIKRVAKITKKYSAKINKIRLEKESLGSERKNTKLLVECHALERERLIVASAALRGTVKAGAKDKAAMKAKRALISVMLDYNRMATKCSEAADLELTRISGVTADEVASSERNIIFPKVAYRRELTETIGDEVRVIGDRLMTPTSDADAAEDNKLEDVFAQDKTTDDRAAGFEALMIKDLREKSAAVNSKWSMKKYFKYAKKVRKKLSSTVKQTERSIIKAFDKNDVIFSIVEGIRVRGKLIELGAINVALANKMRVGKQANKEAKLLREDIFLYNERAIDYSTLTGEQFNRVSTLLPNEVAKRGCEIYVPSISYRESYIEVYPKDATVDMFFVKPERRSSGDYIPLAFKNRRLTENNSVEITIINSPHIAEEYLYGPPATKVIHHWFSEGMSDFIEIRLNKALKKVKKRIKENEKLDRKFESKLAKLNKSLDNKIFKLESVSPGGEKESGEYKQKLVLANKKFSKELTKLRIRRASAAIERKRIRLMAEQFVIEREFLVVSCRKLFLLRSYGWRGVLRNAKREVIDRIEKYNLIAKQFSEALGEPIAQASTAIADDIIKYGKTIVFPYIAMCRELIETLAGKPRIIGEKYRGSMRMGVDIKGNPVMQPFPTTVPEMATKIASPTIGVDAYGDPVIGATHSGLIYMGGDVSPELNAQFTENNNKDTSAKTEDGREGKPHVITPYDMVKAGEPIVGIPANVSEEFFEPVGSVQGQNAGHKLGFNGAKVFPINPLANEIEEYAVEAIKAQSRTITNLSQWHRHLYRSWLTRQRLNSALRYSKKKRLKVPYDPNGSGATNLERSNEAVRNFYLLQEMVVQGMIVETRCANLYAIAKLGVWWRTDIRTKKLQADIEKYNQYISAVSGADEFDLTSVSMLLADSLANKTGTEKIPRIHVKERFLEVDSSTVGDAMPILPTISSEKSLEDVPVHDKESFLYYSGRAHSLINSIDNQTAKYSKVLKKRIHKLRWFRRRKIRATARYNRQVFELSCKIDNTVKYQKKLHKIKWKYSKHIFKITRRETMPLNSIRLFFAWRKKYPMCSYIGFDDITDFAILRDYNDGLDAMRQQRLSELAAEMTAREAKDAAFINTLTKFSLNAEKNRVQVEKKYARRRERDEASRKLSIANMKNPREKWYRFGHWFLFLAGKRDEPFIGKRDPNGAPLENTPERNVLTRAALEREKVVVSAKIYAKLIGAINLLERQMSDYERQTVKDARSKAQYNQDREDLKALRRLLPRTSREFSTAVSMYNLHLSEVSYSLQIPVTTVDNSFIKNIESSGTVPELPRLAWRGEIIETIGEEERSAGIRRVM